MTARSTGKRATASTGGDAFPHSNAWDRPGFLLWHTTLAWQRAVAEALKPLGLTHVQFVLLAGTRWLDAQGGGRPSQRELADHAGTDVMMTSQVVRTLEQRGLLDRLPDPNDARVRRLRCTPAGSRLAKRAVAVVEKVDLEFFGDGRERSAAVKVLERLAPRAEHG